MFCNRCNNQVSSDVQVCPRCGQQMNLDNTIEIIDVPFDDNQTRKPTKKNNIPLVLGLTSGVVIFLITIIYLVFNVLA